MRSPWPFVLAGLAVLSTQARAGDPDIELSMSVRIEVDRRGDSDFDVTSETEVTQKYLSKRSTDMREFTVTEQYYDPVSDFRGELDGYPIDPSNFSFELAPGSDVFLSDFKVHTMSLPKEPQVGQTVSYRYEKAYRSPAFLPILEIPNVDFVKSYTLVIEHPEDVAVDFDVFVPRGDLSYSVEHPDDDETVLRFANIRESEKMPGFPYNGLRAAVMIRMKRGATAVTPTAVPDFVEWYRRSVELAPTLAAPYDTVLASTLKSLRSDRERVGAIYDYVRRTIRYIADEHASNAFVPRSPSLVLERGYGDCKDRAYLVAAIARKHGIKVNMALVATRPQPQFAGEHVTLYNHVICEYDDGGAELFFDPTARYCEFGNLPGDDIGASALILDPDGPRRAIVSTTRRQPDLEVEITGTLAEPKKARATVVLRSDLFQFAAKARERSSGLDFENAVSNLVTGRFQKLSFDYFEPQSQTDSTMTLGCQVDLSEFVIASSAKTYIAQTPFSMSDASILERERDTLVLDGDEREHLRLVIDLDATGHSAEASHVGYGTGDPARYDAELTSLADGRYRFRYELDRSGGIMRGATRAAYLEFCRSFLKSKKNMFVLTRTTH
jgi:transglutaminase-like putative cysteine protease